MGIPISLLAALASSWYMTGLIWFVQVVHYPLFARVGEGRFEAYHAEHARLTTLVVAVPMLVELASAAALAWREEAGIPTWLSWTGLGLAGLAWASTMLVQVPLHGRLGGGFEASAHGRLVATNLVRSLVWTGHAAVALAQLAAWARGAGRVTG